MYNIGIGLFIVVWLQYKLKDFKCDYGANTLAKLMLSQMAFINGALLVITHANRC